jgi:hypothetical protein
VIAVLVSMLTGRDNYEALAAQITYVVLTYKVNVRTDLFGTEVGKDLV